MSWNDVVRITEYLLTEHSKTPHVVTVLWLESDNVVTILSPTGGTSGRLQNHVSVPLWFLHSDYTSVDIIESVKLTTCAWEWKGQ